MTLEPDAAYLALKARDPRFDGRMFVGVTSTGIYCRPVCRVRTPKRENCRFFANAASAERAGFRPCLRCRPELAPGLSLMDSSQVLAQHAARMLDGMAQGRGAGSIPEVAQQLGVTGRHLRRILLDAFGVSPIEYLGTQRLLQAKHLLTDTDLAVAQVALASGFASVRRFNAAFAKRYRMSPTALRRERGAAATEGPLLKLGYRPPYDIEGVLRFFGARCIDGVETVEGQEFSRTLCLPCAGKSLSGWIALRFAPERHEVHVRLAPSLAPAAVAVLHRVRQALDLDADPQLIEAALKNGLPPEPRPGVRVPNGFDGFEIATRVILGQQVTVAAARTLVCRLVERFGDLIETPFPRLARLFPSPDTIARADPEAIGKLGIVRQRVRALQVLAGEVHAGRICLHRGAPLSSTMDALRVLPGIGEWTVQLIAMRALAWPDAFVPTDIGVLNALHTRDVGQVEQQAEAWRPWRAYAVMRLWQSLETGA
ncbi:MAG TPA: Ada metal-binding domain-containing protein [Burkholderiaceae bacterium]|nr:Ada metal-binding domain-containing protein [Burkholderiaceae bacterium]